MSKVRAISPVADGTERTVMGPAPPGGEPAEHAIGIGAAAEPGIHQPAHVPEAMRTWRRPRIMADRSSVTVVVGTVTLRPLASDHDAGGVEPVELPRARP